jgi:hypothetical protein
VILARQFSVRQQSEHPASLGHTHMMAALA